MVDKYTAGSQYGCHFRQEHEYASGSVCSHILLTISLCSLKMSGNSSLGSGKAQNYLKSERSILMRVQMHWNITFYI